MDHDGSTVPRGSSGRCDKIVRSTTALAATFLAITFGMVTPARAQPLAIDHDPPLDRLHPASGEGVQFISRGERVNAMLYSPAGAGPHRAVILLHGLPGNEQNLDLARAMQRQGWAVITFHYRGSWGSGGHFSLDGGCDDVDALMQDLSSAAGQHKWDVDPRRIVIVGHSYGGFVAACSAQRHPEFLGAGLIAPWDIGYDAKRFSRFTPKEAQAFATSTFDDVDGRLVGADAQSLMASMRGWGARPDLAAAASVLVHRPLLIATAARDDPDDQAAALIAKIIRTPGARRTIRQFDTDHGFNDQRVALETYVLEWLTTLPAGLKPN